MELNSYNKQEILSRMNEQLSLCLKEGSNYETVDSVIEHIFTELANPFIDYIKRDAYLTALKNIMAEKDKTILKQSYFIEDQNNIIVKQKEAVDFMNEVRNSSDCINLDVFAKLLGDCSGERLVEFLTNIKVFYKCGEINTPNQTYIDRGYFKMRESVYEDSNFTTRLHIRPCITAKGQVWLSALWKKYNEK